ncbi:MAG: Holliday junction resolvase RuvX [Mycoplasmatales bacterium]|nr:Holliday junction resolvase RuvX [Mycoplasmatales bacterium]
MRKIGLDIGSKSCGIALSDPLNITAQGKENLKFELWDWDFMLNHLDTYFDNYEIDTIVIGYPTYPSGDKSETTYMIEEVETLLKKRYQLPIIRINESMTTKRAHETLISSGMKRNKRKKYKDQLAAQFILSDYLSKI